MTDRQTDKASCWIATAYNDEILLLEDATKYPQFVKEVHGGREMCPTTGKLHFQGAIFLHSQQRLSALKRWLPTAHLETAKSRDAVKRYCMKKDTAVGEKTVRGNALAYFRMDEWLTMLGNTIRDLKQNDIQQYIDLVVGDEDRSKEYWYAVNVIIKTYPHAIASFTDARFKLAWRHTAGYWISRPTLSITESADKKDQGAESRELISPAGIYNAVDSPPCSQADDQEASFCSSEEDC